MPTKSLVFGFGLLSLSALGVASGDRSFLRKGVHTRVNATAAQEVVARTKGRAMGKPTGYTASGCWKAPSVTGRIDFEGVRKMSSDECFGFCSEKKGMEVFGTVKGSQCWCGTLFDGAKSGGGTACDYPCTGDKEKMCGGIDAANVYVMYDCTPPTEAEEKAAAKKKRDGILKGFATFDGQTCGEAADNKLNVDGSDTMIGSVEECKMACHNSMQCHGFTYEEGMQKCSFKYDVTDGDVKKAKKIKCYWKKLGLLFVQKSAPDMSEEVKREANENIQIHDAFAAQETESKEKERKVKADKSLSFAQFSKRSTPDVSEEVKKEFAQNIQIHDVFSAKEKEDVKKEKAVKANKELRAL